MMNKSGNTLFKGFQNLYKWFLGQTYQELQYFVSRDVAGVEARQSEIEAAHVQ